MDEQLRQSLCNAHRIVVKAGTGIVTEPSGLPSLSRIGAIVEQICLLSLAGKEVIFVSSGAVGIGRHLLRRRIRALATDQNINELKPLMEAVGGKGYNPTCAGAGQLGLLSLYDTLFHQWDVQISQLLLTEFDFRSEDRHQYLVDTMTNLLRMGIVPILNENDAVSGNKGYMVEVGAFSDNDGLAGLVASHMKADLLILLTDVEGVYSRPPNHPDARLISHYSKDVAVKFGGKSEQGRGGMVAKIRAATNAFDQGVKAVVIASGKQQSTITQIISGQKIGTLFMSDPIPQRKAPRTPHTSFVANPLMGYSPTPLSVVPSHSNTQTNGGGSGSESGQRSAELREIARKTRDAGRRLANLPASDRAAILHAISDSLLREKEAILAANQDDLDRAKRDGIGAEIVRRLTLTASKIDTLAKGIRTIANSEDPIGRVVNKTEVSKGLRLTKVSVPIGCILVVFESRPDSLPQICSLCLRTGNGLILKGGKEAASSNQLLHRIICESIVSATQGRVPRDVVSLISDRTEVNQLLAMSDLIDLVIPRGSGSMVASIKNMTQIPVLGHAEGICHVYVDAKADLSTALSVCVDAKTDYPAACNAMETLLIHESHCDNTEGSFAVRLLKHLRDARVQLLCGPLIEAQLSTFKFDGKVQSFKTEYGELILSVEMVPSMRHAIDHIHKYGSSHTDVILTQDAAMAQQFLKEVDSACVFWNASPRFADGYRFGLGAEVGISTGRIHSRGPVGAEGLLTTKWLLESESSHVVAGDRNIRYTHQPLPISSKL